MWHTYEAGPASRPLYQLAGSAESLWPGDPVRNVGAVRGATPVLVLVEPVDESGGGIEELDLGQVITTNLFVNRQAQAEFYLPAGAPELIPSVREALQVADALASLADGGVVPTGVFTRRRAHRSRRPRPCRPRPRRSDRNPRLDPVRSSSMTPANGCPCPRPRASRPETAELLADINGEAKHVTSRPGQAVPKSRATQITSLAPRRTRSPWTLKPASSWSSDASRHSRGSHRCAAGSRESSGFFVRNSPGPNGGILGKLDYSSLEVTVLGAQEVPAKGPPIEDLWYTCALRSQRLLQPHRQLRGLRGRGGTGRRSCRRTSVSARPPPGRHRMGRCRRVVDDRDAVGSLPRSTRRVRGGFRGGRPDPAVPDPPDGRECRRPRQRRCRCWS